MNTRVSNAEPMPVFHEGEQAMHDRIGKRDIMEHIGRQIIRTCMPDQHRKFYAQLPFMVVGSVADDGWPWASLLIGKPGFVQTPDETTLNVSAKPFAADPLAKSLKSGRPLGLLGIELQTRRRNRVNAHVAATTSDGFTLDVDMTFGNCPQYIQTRSVDFVRDPADVTFQPAVTHMDGLDAAARVMISAADTFFVASYVVPEHDPRVEGVDVSHRGGRPGFVRVEGNTLTIPDYPGNNAFNTLGNFFLNPKAGLIFPDFESGDLLQLTGTVELLWEDEAEVQAFKGAQRGWRFTVEKSIRLKAALPFRSVLHEFSPNSLLTGDWKETTAILQAQEKQNTWRPFRLLRTEDESTEIRSFYLEPTDDSGIPQHEAGQFITLRVTPPNREPIIRTYTVSSAPGEAYYRISVKRETMGAMSRYLHDVLKPGDQLEVKAARGDFFIDPAETRPAVLLAGGVGITPMLSMAEHVMNHAVLERHARPLTLLHAAHTTAQRAFNDRFRQLERENMGSFRYISFISHPQETDKTGVDYNGRGYISADALRQVLPLDDYDFFLCGPPAFMQAMYDAIRGLGVADKRIFAEAFGPASLKRIPDEGSHKVFQPALPEAKSAVVKFTRSDFEQAWSGEDGTLLELAEAHGLKPEYGCRSGSCGSCAVKLKSGKVAYRSEVSAAHADDEVLICCAVPAEGGDMLELGL